MPLLFFFRCLLIIMCKQYLLHFRYDPLSSCLVDFKGRANMASVKNCQFVVSDPNTHSGAGSSSGGEAKGEASTEALSKLDADKEFVLQLGKVSELFS